MSNSNIIEGVFAINKPQSITSAQVVRNVQAAFDKSELFAPWLAAEAARIEKESQNQRRRRKQKRLNVKVGHGGTLDPLATGVLIIGVGRGTKQLGNFLGCTKGYEAAVLFGAATDTYDILGKVLSKGPYAHITKEKVESALQSFRGNIMQQPPIYSALHMNGKRLYEYAREGKELPKEIEKRPVEVKSLEMTEWMEGGSHSFAWPKEEAPKIEKEAVEKLLHLDGCPTEQVPETLTPSATKRKRSNSEDNEADQVVDRRPPSKRHDFDDKDLMSGALPSPDIVENTEDTPQSPQAPDAKDESVEQPQSASAAQPPAAKLTMSVTSGFYVRSLCHDLGKELGSFGFMASLVRSQQGDFKLGENVLEYTDLEKGEEIWGPKVSAMMRDWNEKINQKEP